MVKYIGRFNVDFAGSIYDGKIPYEMIIISEFYGNAEIGRKCFYFRRNSGNENCYIIPRMETEAEIEKWFKHRNNARFSVYTMANTYRCVEG